MPSSPPRDGHHEQPGQQPHQPALGQLGLGEVAGVEQQDGQRERTGRAGSRRRAAGRSPAPARCRPGRTPSAAMPITTTARNSIHSAKPGGSRTGRPAAWAPEQVPRHRHGHQREDQHAEAERPPQRVEQQQAGDRPGRQRRARRGGSERPDRAGAASRTSGGSAPQHRRRAAVDGGRWRRPGPSRAASPGPAAAARPCRSRSGGGAGAPPEVPCSWRPAPVAGGGRRPGGHAPATRSR